MELGAKAQKHEKSNKALQVTSKLAPELGR